MDAQRLVRARVLAVVIFATSVLYQIYAFVTQPARLEDLVYAPHPYFLMAFVAIQIGLQFCWIVQMFHSNEPSDAFPLDIRDVDSDRALEPAQMAYVPYFVISNICIVASTLAWGWDHPILSQVFTVSNAACQLYFVFFALHSSGKYEWTQKTRLTHLVAKSSAGVAVLYMWRAWGVLDINSWRPALQQQVHCGVLFLLLAFASGPDPTLGLCLLLDLVALAAGNTKEEWRFAFFCIIGVLFVVVLSDWMLAWKNRYAPRTSPIDPEDEESAFHESPFQDEILMSDLRVENPAIESGRS